MANTARNHCTIDMAPSSTQHEPAFRHISRSNLVRLDVARWRFNSVNAPCPHIARAIRLLHPSGEDQMILRPLRTFLWEEFRLIQFDMKDPTGPINRVLGPIIRAVSSLNDSGIRILARISGWSDYPVVRLSGFYCIGKSAFTSCGVAGRRCLATQKSRGSDRMLD